MHRRLERDWLQNISLRLTVTERLHVDLRIKRGVLQVLPVKVGCGLLQPRLETVLKFVRLVSHKQGFFYVDGPVSWNFLRKMDVLH